MRKKVSHWNCWLHTWVKVHCCMHVYVGVLEKYVDNLFQNQNEKEKLCLLT